MQAGKAGKDNITSHLSPQISLVLDILLACVGGGRPSHKPLVGGLPDALIGSSNSRHWVIQEDFLFSHALVYLRSAWDCIWILRSMV